MHRAFCEFVCNNQVCGKQEAHTVCPMLEDSEVIHQHAHAVLPFCPLLVMHVWLQAGGSNVSRFNNTFGSNDVFA